MVRFFPSLKYGWGFTAPQNKRKMEKQRQIFRVKYTIYYNSGASDKGTMDVIAISEIGAIDIIKWLFRVRNITINSVIPTLKYVGAPIIPDYEVLGNY